METKPDTIHISASHRQEVQATHADLFVTVRGSSVVSGDQAMKKAREVSALVEEIVRFGIPAENIHLQGVRVDNAGGTILKSSSASYRLRVRTGKVEQIAGLLEIVGAQKNVTLERIVWKYAEEEAHARGLESAIAAARSKGEKVAAALGVKLLGVYQFNENVFDEEAPAHFQPQAMMMKTARGAPEPEQSLGMDIQHSKTIQTNVEIEFRISGL